MLVVPVDKVEVRSVLKPGTRIGDYEIIRVLGPGGTAVTYSARHVEDQRDVALKVPTRQALADTTYVIRFLQEGALGCKLKHPSIVKVLEVGEDGDQLFMAMELVEGTTLAFELAGHMPMPMLRSLNVTREVADALGHAHANGVVHRNLKPGHIMVLAGGRVKVMDLGVARVIGEVGLTSSDVLLGTPQYTAPEGDDPRALDHRSDLYSLGIILFEMLQGHPPFNSVSPIELMIMHKEEPFPVLEELAVPVPEEVWGLMDRMCRKHPEERPQTATEVVDEVDRIFETVSLQELQDE
jgi:serine/threonine-protein kinase